MNGDGRKDPDDEMSTVQDGSGDPNDDREYLQDQPPAQVDETPKHSPVEEDEDPITHDVRAATEGTE